MPTCSTCATSCGALTSLVALRPISQSGTPACVDLSPCRGQVDIQATFNYFGQINPLRIATGLTERAVACPLSRAQGALTHLCAASPLEVFRQSTILNQADIGNELVPRLQIQNHFSSHAPCKSLQSPVQMLLPLFSGSGLPKGVYDGPLACMHPAMPSLLEAACSELALSPRTYVKPRVTEPRGSDTNSNSQEDRNNVEASSLIKLYLPGHWARCTNHTVLRHVRIHSRMRASSHATTLATEKTLVLFPRYVDILPAAID